MIDGVRFAPARICSAVDWLDPVTSGTCVAAGPFDTESVIVDPLDTLVPACGVSETTTPCAESDSTSTRCTTKPAPWSADLALAYGCCVTSGTAIGFAPRETLMWTTVPLMTLSPACGCCAVT